MHKEIAANAKKYKSAYAEKNIPQSTVPKRFTQQGIKTSGSIIRKNSTATESHSIKIFSKEPSGIHCSSEDFFILCTKAEIKKIEIEVYRIMT